MNIISTDMNMRNKIYFLTLVLFGILLNQSGKVFGFNISLADIIFLLMLIGLIKTKNFVFKRILLLFFLIVSIICLFTSFFFVPYMYHVSINGYDVGTNYLKFVIVFLYMILGYNLARLKLEGIIIKAFCFGGIIIGVVGLVLILTNSSLLNEILFFSASRYKGLMNDPNYFAVIQVAVLACIIRLKATRSIVKYSCIVLLFFSVLISGSKTGFITLILYLLFITVESIYKSKSVIAIGVLIVTTSLSLLLNISNIISNSLEKLSSSMPILYRVNKLLSNPAEALSSEGSGRTMLWTESLNIIEKSPILGVGFGTFEEIMEINTGTSEVAHNTYIQIITEWGVLLGVIFIIGLFFMLMKSFFNKNNSIEHNAAKDIVFVLLVGSLGISLNNSRLLWFFLGILFYYSTTIAIRLRQNKRIIYPLIK